MADVEGVGIDLADLGDAIVVLTGRPEPLGPQDKAILMNMDLDVATDRLLGDRIELVILGRLILTRRGRRSDVIDQRNQRYGIEDDGVRSSERRTLISPSRHWTSSARVALDL